MGIYFFYSICSWDDLNNVVENHFYCITTLKIIFCKQIEAEKMANNAKKYIFVKKMLSLRFNSEILPLFFIKRRQR